MKLLVLLYGAIPAGQKPAGIPDLWPASVTEVEDAADTGGLLALTREEFAAYQATHRATYDAWAAPTALSALKASACAQIDQRTTELIEEGFEFSGKRFSLSANAQNTLNGSYGLRDDPSFVYPVVWNTIDDADSLSIVDSFELRAFYLTAVGTYRAHLADGTDLKAAVRGAATVAALRDVVDNR